MQPANYAVTTDLVKVNDFLSRMLGGKYLVRIEVRSASWYLAFAPSLERSSSFDLTSLQFGSPFWIGDEQKWSESMKVFLGSDDSATERIAFMSMQCTDLLGAEVVASSAAENGLLELQIGKQSLFVDGEGACPCCVAWSLTIDGVGISVKSVAGPSVSAHPLLRDLLQ